MIKRAIAIYGALCLVCAASFADVRVNGRTSTDIRIQGVQDTVTDVDTRLGVTSNYLDVVAAVAGVATNDIFALQGDVSSISNTIDQATNDLAGLDARFVAASGTLSQATGDLANVTADLAGVSNSAAWIDVNNDWQSGTTNDGTNAVWYFANPTEEQNPATKDYVDSGDAAANILYYFRGDVSSPAGAGYLMMTNASSVSYPYTNTVASPVTNGQILLAFSTPVGAVVDLREGKEINVHGHARRTGNVASGLSAQSQLYVTEADGTETNFIDSGSLGVMERTDTILDCHIMIGRDIAFPTGSYFTVKIVATNVVGNTGFECFTGGNTGSKVEVPLSQSDSLSIYGGTMRGDIDMDQHDVTDIASLSASNAILGPLTYPTSDGASNQIVCTDGAGNLSFCNMSASVDISKSYIRHMGIASDATNPRTNVIFRAGSEGYAGAGCTNYWRIANDTTQAVDNMAVTSYYTCAYISENSTWPTPTIYFTQTTNAFNTTNSCWASSTNYNDRYFGFVYTDTTNVIYGATNGQTTEAWYLQDRTKYLLTSRNNRRLRLIASGVSDDTWNAPTVEPATLFPVSVKDILLHTYGLHAANQVYYRVGTYEAVVDGGSNANDVNFQILVYGFNRAVHNGWFTLGTSGKILFIEENDDNDAFEITVHGWQDGGTQ